MREEVPERADYQLHTPDPQVPIEDTLGALDELV
jgi:aryl-alcohol dehydrogenase-like predicted oxidoreductase